MEIFGIEHILFLVISIVIMAALIVIFKLFVPKEKMYIVMKMCAGIGLILIIINRIVVSLSRDGTFLDFLPDTYCSMMGFIMPIAVLCFKPNSKTFQYAMFAGMIGGILTMFYPDFFVYFDNVFNIHPFTGYLYHANMFFMFVVAIATGYFKPTFKNFMSLVVGLAFMVVVGEFGNSVLGQSNNMYLNAPLISNTVFTWWFVCILYLVIYALFLQIYEMLTLKPADWSVVKVWNFLKNKLKKSENIEK